MARIGIYGFEARLSSAGGLAETGGSVTGTLSFSTSIKRYGSYAVRANVSASTSSSMVLLQRQDQANWQLGGSTETATTRLSVHLYVVTAPTSTLSIVEFRNAANSVKGKLRIIAASGGYQVSTIDSAASTETCSTVIPLLQWHRIEILVTSSATVGQLNVFLDGNQIDGGFGGKNTLATGANNWQIGADTGGGSDTFDFYFDDVVVSTSTVGNSCIALITPDAAGTDQTWTASAGTHVTTVDDWVSGGQSDDDTTYNSVSASGTQAEEENCTAITSDANSINTALPLVLVRNTSGSANNGTGRLRSNTTNSDATASDPGATFVTRGKVFETDPATGSAWTVSAINAAQVGYVKTQSQARAVRFTAAGILVEYVPVDQSVTGANISSTALYTPTVSLAATALARLPLVVGQAVKRSVLY